MAQLVHMPSTMEASSRLSWIFNGFGCWQQRKNRRPPLRPQHNQLRVRGHPRSQEQHRGQRVQVSRLLRLERRLILLAALEQ